MRLLFEVGSKTGTARFFGGRIALDTSPGAEAGRNEAATLFAASGEGSSDISRVLVSFGIELFVNSVDADSSLGRTGATGFGFGALRCATLFLGAGFLTGVVATSNLASEAFFVDSIRDTEDGCEMVGCNSGIDEARLLLDLRG